jgi:hypothetical protein
MAHGVGDSSAPAQRELAVPGLALRPLSPVMLSAKMQTNGDILISWIRRSRDGWRWVDGVDAPLAEQQELYAITLSPSVGPPRSIQSTSSTYVYDAAYVAADKASGAASVTIAVVQIGTLQASLAATLTFPLV